MLINGFSLLKVYNRNSLMEIFVLRLYCEEWWYLFSLRWSPSPNKVSLTVLIGERKAWVRNILAPNIRRFDIEEEITKIIAWIGSEKNSALIVSVNLSYISTAQKMKFSIKDFFSKCDQICMTFTEEMLNGKLHFLCNVGVYILKSWGFPKLFCKFWEVSKKYIADLGFS